MKIPSNILHDKQYADKILEITADTMFFVYKDGTCLDFKANTTDFFIKEQDIIGRNIFSYFPVETARGDVCGIHQSTGRRQTFRTELQINIGR